MPRDLFHPLPGGAFILFGRTRGVVFVSTSSVAQLLLLSSSCFTNGS